MTAPKDVAGARKAYEGAGQQVTVMTSAHTEPLGRNISLRKLGIQSFLYLSCIFLAQTAANSLFLPGVAIQTLKSLYITA